MRCLPLLSTGLLLWVLWLTGFSGAGPVVAKPAPVNVLTYLNDLSRTGQNLRETVLNPVTVNSNQFGRLFVLPVDGYVYAQPLYVSGLSLPGKGRHNVVFVATEHDSVYAFDADGAGPPLWKVNFLDEGHGVTTPKSGELGSNDIVPEVGITGTPVIDLASDTIYLVSKTKLQPPGGGPVEYRQSLHALDIRTGQERPGSPVEIRASVPGRGDGGDRHNVPFDAHREHQRCGLLLLNGVVYIAWASHGDNGPYHGWLIGYDARTLRQVTVFNTSPNASQNGIWMSGAAPAADAAGHIFLATGNGSVDPPNGGYGEAFLNLSTAGGLAVQDYFIPSNWLKLNQADLDLGSGGVLLLPDSVGSPEHRRLLVSGGKAGDVYVVDRDTMGHLSDKDQWVQMIPRQGGGELFSAPAYFNGMVYLTRNGDHLKAYRVANGRLSETPVSQSAGAIGARGGGPVVSANGAADGIVWAIEVGVPGVLHAYDAADLSKELWSSHSQRDSLQSSVKFTAPTVAAGKVYVGTQNSLVVYGLLKAEAAPPPPLTELRAKAVSSSVVELTWTEHPSNASGILIERSVNRGAFAPYTTSEPGLSTYRDTGLMGGATYRYRIRATNSAGASAASAAATAVTPLPDLTPGLVGWWKLDEGQGKVAADSSGKQFNGKLEGETGWSPGRIGRGAVSFHAAGHAISRVVVPDNPLLRFNNSESYTLAVWANPEILKDRMEGIVTKQLPNTGPYYGLWVNADNHWMAGSPGGDLLGGEATPGWHHLTLVQDAGAKLRHLYVDGRLVATGPAAAADGQGDLWFGGSQSDPGQTFAGSVDDVRLYDRALDPGEIQALAAGR